MQTFRILGQHLLGEKYVAEKKRKIERKLSQKYWTLCSAATPKGSAHPIGNLITRILYADFLTLLFFHFLKHNSISNWTEQLQIYNMTNKKINTLLFTTNVNNSITLLAACLQHYPASTHSLNHPSFAQTKRLAIAGLRQ